MKVFGRALLAVFALGSLVSASAGALPLVLPEGGGKSTSTASTSTILLETAGGISVKCEKATGTATEEGSTPLGPFHVTLTGCQTQVGGVTVKCTGLGDANAGENLILGVYHLVYDTEGTELGVAILGLPEAVHYTCGGLVLTKTEGSELCLILEPYVLKTLFEAHCVETKGVSKDPTYLNDKKETVKAGLKLAFNEGAAESAADLGLGLGLELKSGKNVDVLIMMN